jgi:2-succinyl-5-enolpyruvyl-6-hydroxy-3-cyclohexene-1-carboxylate synthase
MMKKINRNHLWASVFINQLNNMGVKYACISPGSRSTPLTYTLAIHKKIKCFVNIDERSSAFIALGLAKATNTPVIVVTTSGTAAVELYPGIVEAYQQRVPLIICTADRPPELTGTGANQTINQRNLYRNHIRWFKDVGTPSIRKSGIQYLQKIAIRAFKICTNKNRGPVHLNFPFRKPLEPNTFTDEVDENITEIVPQIVEKNDENLKSLQRNKRFKEIVSHINNSEKGLIIAGLAEYDSQFRQKLKKFSAIIAYPLIADASSHLRFSIGKSDNNVIANYHSFLQSKNFIALHQPEIILQFGRTVTSSSLENYLSEIDAPRYSINEYGDSFDPSRKTKAIIKYDPVLFCDELIKALKDENINRTKTEWQKDFINSDKDAEDFKARIILSSKFPNEARIIPELLKQLPNKTNIMIGNSLPIRDFDNFASTSTKDFKIFINRGASGIDGVTSTAAGIAAICNPTVLITGDLSFIHDINALHFAKKYSVPLTIILINNSGGGIFESLLILKQKKLLKEYFITPHSLDLSKLTESFKIKHTLIKTWKQLKDEVLNSIGKKQPQVLELKTNATESLALREKFWSYVKSKIDSEHS